MHKSILNTLKNTSTLQVFKLLSTSTSGVF